MGLFRHIDHHIFVRSHEVLDSYYTIISKKSSTCSPRFALLWKLNTDVLYNLSGFKFLFQHIYLSSYTIRSYYYLWIAPKIFPEIIFISIFVILNGGLDSYNHKHSKTKYLHETYDTLGAFYFFHLKILV